jgi:hypothetical protein
VSKGYTEPVVRDKKRCTLRKGTPASCHEFLALLNKKLASPPDFGLSLIDSLTMITSCPHTNVHNSHKIHTPSIDSTTLKNFFLIPSRKKVAILFSLCQAAFEGKWEI